MKTKLKHLHEKLFATYWFIPSLMCLLVIAAAYGILAVDASVEAAGGWGGGRWIEVNTAEGAREFLSTIASSTITLAGVIFSITILALSFASSQYGPRLLRNFMRDRASQLVLGTFVSTYLYCLLILRTVGGGAGEPSVPHTAIVGALVLALVTTSVLIFFIHHVARAIQVSTIVSGVGRDLDKLIQEYAHRALEQPSSPDPLASIRGQHGHPVGSRCDGYVQALSYEQLVEAATAGEGTIEMHVAPGDYLSRGQRLATLYTERAEVSEKTLALLREAVVLGTQRTNEQDIEFPIDQLAEIAVRALSPSMNDPFTAIMCIDRLGSALDQLAAFDWPEPVVRNEEGAPLVNLLPRSMERLLHRAFSQILHFGESNPVIVRQVMKMLAQVAPRSLDVHAPAIVAYADQIMARAKVQRVAGQIPELAELHETATVGKGGKPET